MFCVRTETKIVSNHKLIKFIFIYETYTDIPERDSPGCINTHLYNQAPICVTLLLNNEPHEKKNVFQTTTNENKTFYVRK